VRLTGKSGIGAVAAEVASVLSKAGIEAVLSGGACASIHTAGRFQSADLDFILQGDVRRAGLDAAMASAEFRRQGDRYFHPLARFYIEFPRGPLAVGRDHEIRPVATRVGGFVIHLLSPTDSCRDRLAAFLHWRDRQSLRTAVTIALRNPIDLKKVRAWCTREGFPEGYEEFLAELQKAQKKAKRARKSRSV
jgi:hypothetical protein